MRGEILGDYGLVRITVGKHKGEMGYYDNEDERGRAIVYLEGSQLLSADYVSIRFRSLERIEITSLNIERFTREHAGLAMKAGIRLTTRPADGPPSRGVPAQVARESLPPCRRERRQS